MKPVRANSDNGSSEGKSRNTVNTAFQIRNNAYTVSLFRNAIYAVKAVRNSVVADQMNRNNQKVETRFSIKESLSTFDSVITE